MSRKATIWIDRPMEIELDGEGFKVTSRSGELIQHAHISRHLLRQFIETSRQILNAVDRAEQHRIEQIRHRCEEAV